MLQFGTRRYRAFAYWFFAYAIAISGTGVSDFLHLDVGIPYAGTTLLWAVVLVGHLLGLAPHEGTLSIHSITTQRRECFYWATVFATFALGTALGDFTATALGLGYLASGILFGIVILIPAVAWWKLGLNELAAFWFAYVVTRPLGASFADYISKPPTISGIGFGDGPTALVFTLAVAVLVLYLAIARPDIQPADIPWFRLNNVSLRRDTPVCPPPRSSSSLGGTPPARPCSRSHRLTEPSEKETALMSDTNLGDRLMELARLDWTPSHRQPSGVRLAIATIVSLLGISHRRWCRRRRRYEGVPVDEGIRTLSLLRLTEN